MNLFNFSRLYRESIDGLGDSSTVVCLSLETVDPGKVRVLTHVTAEDLTNSFTKIRLRIKHASRIFYLDELDSPAANELCVARSDIVLGEYDILQAEFTGTTDSDVLRFNAIGWEIDI